MVGGAYTQLHHHDGCAWSCWAVALSAGCIRRMTDGLCVATPQRFPCPCLIIKQGPPQPPAQLHTPPLPSHYGDGTRLHPSPALPARA